MSSDNERGPDFPIDTFMLVAGRTNQLQSAVMESATKLAKEEGADVVTRDHAVRALEAILNDRRKLCMILAPGLLLESAPVEK